MKKKTKKVKKKQKKQETDKTIFEVIDRLWERVEEIKVNPLHKSIKVNPLTKSSRTNKYLIPKNFPTKCIEARVALASFRDHLKRQLAFIQNVTPFQLYNKSAYPFSEEITHFKCVKSGGNKMSQRFEDVRKKLKVVGSHIHYTESDYHEHVRVLCDKYEDICDKLYNCFWSLVK